MSDSVKRQKFLLPKAFLVSSFVVLSALLSSCSDQSDQKQASANTTINVTKCEANPKNHAMLDKAVFGEIAAFLIEKKPQPISDISFRDKDGNLKKLSQWRGKTVLLNLWATWCPPCREEMPSLEKLQTEMGGDDFAVLPVSVDSGTIDKAKAFYTDIGLEALPLLHDGAFETINKLKKQGLFFGLPLTLLIDKKGCVIGRLNGPADWASPEAVNLVRIAGN